MRRSLIICLGAALCALLLALLFQYVDGGEDRVRYHQHLEQPSEEELGPCPVCGGKGALCTHLPIINIETGGQKIPGKAIDTESGKLLGYETGDNGEEEILVSFSTVSREGVWHHSDDEPTLEGQAMLRIRGNSSRRFDKSNYRLRVVEGSDPEKEAKLGLLGMEPGTEWALHGPFLDKTLLRNYMWMNLSAEVMGYAPNVRFCEVNIDGEYRGLYVLMETIAVQDGRVELTRYREGSPVCSYLVRIESNSNPDKSIENFTFYSSRMELNTCMELLYPGLARQTEQVKNYVETDISEIEKLLYSMETANGSGAWREEIDMSSFVDYYILEEFLAINDTFSASTYFYRDVRGKLAAGPVWDFNNALDNSFQPIPDDQLILSQRGWFAQLMKDKVFVESVLSRYRQLRGGVLSEERLIEYARSVDEWLGGAVDRNFEVWGYSFDPANLDFQQIRHPELGSGLDLQDVNPSSHEEAMEWMLEYMTDRGRWMDLHIDSLLQYCHPSKLANQVWG